MTYPALQAKRLPIYQKHEEIVETVKKHRVVVIKGPTGSGKTTQIPRMLWHALNCRCIGVTQPRRIAAVSNAWRIAAEEEVIVGDTVGYAIRFDNHSSTKTAIKLMTDGLLLMEARENPDLNAYDVLMIDEAHERNLNIDVILGLTYELLKRRTDLKIIVSSATIYPEQFQTFFAPVAGEVPLVSVEARTYPIDIQYHPIKQNELSEAICEQVLSIHARNDPGHILVFLSGVGAIRETSQAIREQYQGNDLVVLPLYASLTREEQDRVFANTAPRRKIILSTNIAETSVTIPDVRFVIDSGLVKVPYYSPQTGIMSLQEEMVNQASSEQRAGRAGRTAPGITLRLYTQKALKERPELGQEEIKRVELTEVVLRLIDLGIRDVENFPFPTVPPRRQIRSSIRTLCALGAIDQDRNLTTIGQQMVPFPLSPSLARMVIEAADNFPTVVDDVLIVGAFLSTRSPFSLPEGEEANARYAHKRFFHPLGDAIALLKMYRAWDKARSSNDFCERHYLDPEVMAFVKKAHEQLIDIAKQQGIKIQSKGPPEDVVRAVAVGLADRIIFRRGRIYETLGGIRVALHPSSVLVSRPPRIAVAAELVSYARKYAIHVSAISGKWLREINPNVFDRVGKKQRLHKAIQSPAIKTVQLGPYEFQVRCKRGRLYIDIDLTKLKQLRKIKSIKLANEANKVRTRIYWPPSGYFAPISLPNLLSILPVAAFPQLKNKAKKLNQQGVLLTPGVDDGRLKNALSRVLQPAITGRSAGWISIVANGAGDFWLDVMPYYHDALEVSRISIEDLLASEPLDVDLRKIAQTLFDKLEGVIKKITKPIPCSA